MFGLFPVTLNFHLESHKYVMKTIPLTKILSLYFVVVVFLRNKTLHEVAAYLKLLPSPDDVGVENNREFLLEMLVRLPCNKKYCILFFVA